MLRTILIGLDGTVDNEAAVGLALRWAGEFGAMADGLSIVDEPGLMTTEAALMVDIYPDGRKPEPLPHRLRQHAEAIREAFVKRCEEAGVRFRAREGVGAPSTRIVEEAERADLVVLGRPTHFEFGSGTSEGDATLGRVIRECPRPVVMVPRSPREGGSTVVALDGGLPAAHAVAEFRAAGLGRSGPVHVLVAGGDAEEATLRAGRAVDFLRAHDLDARPAVVETDARPAEVILEQIDRLEARLLVMGAHGRSPVREFFAGSTTRRVLDASPIPVFCHR